MSLTKYPMKPITAKPIATALEIWTNSGQNIRELQNNASPSQLTFLRRLGTPGKELPQS